MGIGKGVLLYLNDEQWCKMSGVIFRSCAFWNNHLIFLIFLLRGNIEEENILKTNKYVYSLLLRSVANKDSTLLERTEVILNILEQLTQGNESKSLGIQ